MKKISKMFGFTLAEIMVVLIVIGVLTAILLPIVANSIPDKNVMKFKKANTTLSNVIRELVNSGEYYLEGNLGLLKDGSEVSSITYFCQTLADNLNTKKVNCSTATKSVSDDDFASEDWKKDYVSHLDARCKATAEEIGAEIITSDNIAIWQVNPSFMFSNDFMYFIWDHEINTYDAGDGDILSHYGSAKNKDGNGNLRLGDNAFFYVYKIVCVDIDGIGKGEDPFGYGIRLDGKILYGTRANVWLEKDFQGNDPSEQE